MKIVAYTKEIQEKLKSKVEPAPYLHCGIIVMKGKDRTGEKQSGTMWAIWVWDTREVVEDGMSKGTIYLDGTKPVKDDHKPLKGGGPNASYINAKFIAKMDRQR